MVERSICIREAPGSIPGFSKNFLFFPRHNTPLLQCKDYQCRKENACLSVSLNPEKMDIGQRGELFVRPSEAK